MAHLCSSNALRSGFASAALLAALWACDIRGPGPNESDQGKVTIWRIQEAQLEFEQCSDEPEFRANFTPPERAVGALLSYEVAINGQTARVLECISSEVEQCMAPTPPVTLTVSGNRLSTEGPPIEIPITGFECEGTVRTGWALEDQGDALTLELTTSYMFTGTATSCQELDATYAALSNNGVGLTGCRVRFSGRATLGGVF